MRPPAAGSGAPRLTPEQKRGFHRKRTILPFILFFALLAAYAAFLAASLAANSLLLALPASLACGLSIGLLFIVGHDACHQSFTGSRIANDLIGRIAFLPSLHPFSLWDLGHNRTHHRYNNVRGLDYVWEPMSPSDYGRASRVRRLVYRFYRSPAGILFYYGVEIWARRMFFVLPWRTDDRRASYLWDVLTVWLFLPVQALAVVSLGASLGRGPSSSLLLGLLIPFAAWNGLMSLAIYLHHMHPEIRWYESLEAWRRDNGRLSGTASIRFPSFVGKLLLHIMEHPAHHFAPGVPLYNLVPLQKLVGVRAGARWDWSAAEFLRITRHCKLFDYEKGTWRAFDLPEEGGQTRRSRSSVKIPAIPHERHRQPVSDCTTR